MALLATFLAIVMFQSLLSVAPAQAVSINDCPGGSSSGEGPPSCPNLHNNDLLSQRAFPSEVYRGDSRLPYEIFNRGFESRGANEDIQAHVQGDRAGNSNFISTTGTVGVAETFARSQGLRNLDFVARQPRCTTGRALFYAFIPVLGNFLLESCINGWVTAESFVYVIDTTMARNALYVPDQLRGNPALYHHYVTQDEWAYEHRIERGAIMGVRIYRMTARSINGIIQMRTITFGFDRFAGNPNYREAMTINYDPENDPNSNFWYGSNLNVPELAANQWTRGCSAIDRCRGGSGGHP